MLIPWRLPGDWPHSVEANQSEFRTEPEVAVRGLRN